ncbi:hypothetical protein [Streptomyces sp. AA1529]|uniref:hypothetical protein n=1 Tax=Streptomyces sp. AA1529 TaxID=1203257 RepID=UPI000315A6E7|nr:hypothetical protein [Streptomyces sp. AA1529]
MTRPSSTPPAEAERLLRDLTRALCAVGLLALAFTAVNVTLFATARGVPLAIAVLLDPMLALTLAIVLYADARLASWGLAPPAWSTALRWWAGTTAAAMNTWSSLWPNGTIGWPSSADPAAVLLHLAPCLLLTGLAEAIAAYRKILTTTSATSTAEAPTETNGERPPHSSAPGTDTAAGAHPGAPVISNELLTRARALDAVVQQRTGRPASIRYLRRSLHLGQARARAVRTHLDATHPTPAPDQTRTAPAGPSQDSSDLG